MKKDIISRALEGVKDEYIAEAAQYRAPEIPAEPVCTPARFKKSRFARRAAVAACLAAVVALGAAGAALLNNAPDPAESIAPAQTADDVPRRIPSADQAASDDEPYTDPYVNGVFIPYIYVNNLFRGMDVIKAFVPADYSFGSLSEKAPLPVAAPAAISVRLLSEHSKGGGNMTYEDPDFMPDTLYEDNTLPYCNTDPRVFDPWDRYWRSAGTVLHYTENYLGQISDTLLLKMHYFPEEEKYPVVLRYRHSAEKVGDPEEVAKYVFEKTGDYPEMRPVDVYLQATAYNENDEPYIFTRPESKYPIFYGSFTSDQIMAFAERNVFCYYVSTGQGDSIKCADYDSVPLDYRRTHPKEEWAGKLWFNRLIDDPKCIDDYILSTMKDTCELYGDFYFATEEGIKYTPTGIIPMEE